MAGLTRLLKVGRAADSLGVYVPALVFHKLLALGRVVLFVYLMDQVQIGLWGLGAMIFTIGSSAVTLGSHHGIQLPRPPKNPCGESPTNSGAKSGDR